MRDFVANEWIRRQDIRMFRDFVTGIGAWYWYSTCAPVPYIRISTLFQDIWRIFGAKTSDIRESLIQDIGSGSTRHPPSQVVDNLLRYGG